MCPVTAGIAIATNAAVIGAVGATGAMVAGVAAGAAIGAAIGVGVSGVVNVATGRGFFENAGQSAMFGAIGGGFGAGMGIGGSSVLLSQGTIGIDTFQAFNSIAAGALAPTGWTIAGTAVAGSLMNAMTPDPAQFGYGAQPYEPQGYSSQHAQVTGSGGRQAAAVLASEIKQAKKLRQRQEEVADFGLGMATTGTGLQIA